MVLLITTPTIVAALHALSPFARDQLNLAQTPPEIGAPISHDEVVSLARAFASPQQDENDIKEKVKENGGKRYTLNELLRGSDVYTPPAAKKAEPTPEYLALKKRLQALAEEQAYNQLIAPSSSYNSYKPSPIFTSQEEAESTADNDPLSPSFVLNVFLSILLCGFATFWALKNFQTPAFMTLGTKQKPVAGSAAHSEPVFVLISMFVGLLVGVAEVVVYAAYLRKVAQAKAKEKSFKERKDVVKDDASSSDDTAAAPAQVDQTKEEIWGKGVNGGVRRRVRERWEQT
ncbi:uncharacterized protein TRUGW13939_03634 [Talaromyces rugulosus]|uniref:Uncharacterized protein n=1 Tax=Talaromyces rugulosus TaxID=121627 RepID=A0A7H8QRL9_TALRU|nr:uncharacterized protein TRUGW13939_03634 [Talaromyces rugulosus]QKX56529.1 hypothetical protein TRUGW13939_03634 [Talaromyces rugulosus]